MTDKTTEAARVVPDYRSGSIEVVLGGQAMRLQRPLSTAVCLEIVAYRRANATRAMGAALGVTMPFLQAPKVTYDECQYSVGVYGARVIDELLGRGWDLDEITDASLEALRLLAHGLPTRRQVKEAEGNSGAPAQSTE